MIFLSGKREREFRIKKKQILFKTLLKISFHFLYITLFQ